MAQQVIHLHFRTYPEDHLWVGECIELDVASGGATEQEAARRAEEATRLYLETVSVHGDLERILAEKGVPITSQGEPAPGHLEERTLVLPVGAS